MILTAKKWASVVNRGLVLSFLLTAAGQLCAQSTIVWTTNFYDIRGATLAEIEASIRRSRPTSELGRMHGLTTWRIDWKFGTMPTPNGCTHQGFTSQTHITTLLPRWIPATDATAVVRETWYRYVFSLAQHEAGHAQIAQAAAKELHQRLHALKEKPDCESLKQAVNELGNAVLAEFRQRETNYDRETRHGATQGAIFPPRRDGDPNPTRRRRE